MCKQLLPGVPYQKRPHSFHRSYATEIDGDYLLVNYRKYRRLSLAHGSGPIQRPYSDTRYPINPLYNSQRHPDGKNCKIILKTIWYVGIITMWTNVLFAVCWDRELMLWSLRMFGRYRRIFNDGILGTAKHFIWVRGLKSTSRHLSYVDLSTFY